MLDAFIIEKIKREQEEAREAPRLQNTPPDPLPRRPLPPGSEKREENGNRGVVEIDFNLDRSVPADNVTFTI